MYIWLMLPPKCPGDLSAIDNPYPCRFFGAEEWLEYLVVFGLMPLLICK
jgi:hypothetical protein